MSVADWFNTYYPKPVTGGFPCPRCGTVVPVGVNHSCQPATTWVNPPPPVDPTLVRIAVALERIADALPVSPAVSSHESEET